MDTISEPPLVGDVTLPWQVVHRGFRGAPAGVTSGGASGTITIGEAVVVGCEEMVMVLVVVVVRVVVWLPDSQAVTRAAVKRVMKARINIVLGPFFIAFLLVWNGAPETRC
jgi:hypothetical protein